MSEIKQREEELVAEFELFESWLEKYEYIIELGKELPLLAENEKSDELLIEGCQSRVWLKTSGNASTIKFQADADAIITKGIIALLIRLVDNIDPKELVQYNFGVVQAIGLQEHLSPTRSNGLNGMIKRLKNEALKFC
ncbi:MAG: SufE family protein [Bacteroidetes bacterium]|nr:SufE family protein [Bacteroidota bacterium]